MPETFPRPSVRRTVLIVLFAVLGLAAADRAVRTMWLEQAVPSADLFWIWDADWPRDPVRPHAFQAARWFQLDAVPKEAKLLVLAEEQYRIFLNGTWIGTGRYEEPLEWHAYPVGPHLEKGENVIAAELRSSRGVGGLMVCLTIEGRDDCLVASDGEWRSFREHQPRLSAGRVDDEAAGRPVKVWGRAEAGRWPVPSQPLERPLASACIDSDRPMPAHRIFQIREERIVLEGIEVAIPVWQARWRHFSRGLAVIRLREPAAEVATVGFGRKRRQPVDPDTWTYLVTQPGQSIHATVEGQWFEHVEIAGVEGFHSVWYWPIDEREECDTYFAPDRHPRPRGVWGVEPPRLRSPVQHELWREFQGVPRVARGE